MEQKGSTVKFDRTPFFTFVWRKYHANITVPRRDLCVCNRMEKITKTDAEWRAELTDEQYQILRKKGTERAFTGALYDNHAVGTYSCAACGNKLYRSDQKFDSGCGWPSFFEALPDAVEEHVDNTFGMRRTEITCARCESHLGHVFNDGPRPTGLRYCLNSGAMTFENE